MATVSWYELSAGVRCWLVPFALALTRLLTTEEGDREMQVNAFNKPSARCHGVSTNSQIARCWTGNGLSTRDWRAHTELHASSLTACWC